MVSHTESKGVILGISEASVKPVFFLDASLVPLTTFYHKMTNVVSMTIQIGSSKAFGRQYLIVIFMTFQWKAKNALGLEGKAD